MIASRCLKTPPAHCLPGSCPLQAALASSSGWFPSWVLHGLLRPTTPLTPRPPLLGSRRPLPPWHSPTPPPLNPTTTTARQTDGESTVTLTRRNTSCGGQRSVSGCVCVRRLVSCTGPLLPTSRIVLCSFSSLRDLAQEIRSVADGCCVNPRAWWGLKPWARELSLPQHCSCLPPVTEGREPLEAGRCCGTQGKKDSGHGIWGKHLARL